MYGAMTAYKFQPTWGPLVFSRQTRTLTVLSARYLSLVHITWSELNWTRSPNTRKQMGTYKSHELEFENYVTPCAQFAVSVLCSQSVRSRLKSFDAGLRAWPANAWYNWVDVFRSVQFSLRVNEALEWEMATTVGTRQSACW